MSTSSNADPWHLADKAYQLHHINCPQCTAAGIVRSSQTRCPQGQALWDTYQAAGDPPHFTWLPAPARKPIPPSEPARPAGRFL